MATLSGFVFGYVLGIREGDEGAAEVEEAWRAIRSSDEASQLVAQGMGMVLGLIEQGPSMLFDRLQSSAAGGAGGALRPTG